LTEDGGIVWQVQPHDAHRDFIEMDGEQVGLVVRYGVDDQGVFSVNHDLIWPMLRFHPNPDDATGTHLRRSFGEDAGSDEDGRFKPGPSPTMRIRTGGEWCPIASRSLKEVRLKGLAEFVGQVVGCDGASPLSFQRTIFPSTNKPAAMDTTVITNTSGAPVELSVDDLEHSDTTDAKIGVYGAYRMTKRVLGAGTRTLAPKESITVSVVFEARRAGEPSLALDVVAEQRARTDRVNAILDKLRLETPDPTLNTAFAFAKLHTTESIFRTKAGLLHSPGGGARYYAGIWANDQAEYANPFFGMLGDPLATEAAINAFHQFARFMNPEYRLLPSSIVAEGEYSWHGAGDRGDAAMVAYGAGRFALAYGNPKTAEELWPLIEWSLEYLRRQVTAQGVVASDSDELEGRFPSGKANLCTSSLYYDALRSAVMLGRALGKDARQLDDYSARAASVRGAIERYFGATVAGFQTYRYYDKADLKGNATPEIAEYATRPDVLRAWIAIPLTMDIFERQAGTTQALFSPQLWTADGLATEAGKITYWDRATLYALRGVLAAGEMQRGMEYLQYYSARRLLGEHVPYPFEAYPEGGKAQLAAESALYCRVFTEGMFGIRPTGLHVFSITPRLPATWPSMALKNVHAFGTVFDLKVARASGQRLKVTLHRAQGRDQSYSIDSGATATVDLRS
jgi:hypothetical protein